MSLLKGLFPKNEKKWMGMFFVLVGLWSLVLFFTLSSRTTGVYGLVDRSVDLSFVTIPLLGIILLYTLVTVFIFLAYLVTIRNARRYQRMMYRAHGKPKTLAQLTAISGNPSEFERKNRICSIIIPSRNEESVIKKTVIECLRQTYPIIEVIVVCHNCTDRTYEEASSVNDSRVRVFNLRTPDSGKGLALNYGVEKANGNYLLILDGDAFLSPDFVELTLPMFKDNYAAVQGRYYPSNRNYNLLTKLLSIEGDLWSTPFMTVRSVLEKRCPLGGTGYIIRKDVLKEVGLFDNHLVDDFELTFRLLRANHKIAFAPMSVDYDEKPPTLDIMFRQRARWSRGFLSLLKKRVPESNDLLGHVSWLWPIAGIASLIMLLIPAYAAVHYLLYEYYPYTYSYIPLNLWIVLNAIIYSLQAIILLNENGRKGLRYLPYLIIYNVFSQYYFVTYLKAIFVKSWASTKTQHGFIRTMEKEIIAKLARR